MEDEGEIEYLEEDEDIVQQYVHTATPVIESVESTAGQETLLNQVDKLLIERKPSENKRKYKTSEDDSDYDPYADLMAVRKKRKVAVRKYPSKAELLTNIKVKPSHPPRPTVQRHSDQKIQTLSKSYENKLKSLPNLTVKKQPVSKNPSVKMIRQYGMDTSNKEEKRQTRRIALNDLCERRKLEIKIPDYEDPVCLPVRAIKKDPYDNKKLRQWNNVCLEQYKKTDSVLKPPKGDAVGSTRTIVLRNVKNKSTGKIDTTIYGKTTVENSEGQKKTESFQSVLPKFREKKLLSSYPLIVGSQRYAKYTTEVLLTREENKNEESLVVYKPKEAISAVYRFAGKKNGALEDSEDQRREEKKVLKEVTCCKVCTPCYQASWRGIRKNNNNQSGIVCKICKRTFVSAYNLLTHLKNGHSPLQVRRARKELSRTLASVVEYHYKCRICQEQFISIKMLRKHFVKHQGTEVFKCEVGNHMAS